MSLRDQMLGIFSTASHREDADYSKHIPLDAKRAALMYYRDVVQGSQSHLVGHLMSDPGGEWLREVVRQLSHAHLEIDGLLASGELPPHDHPFDTLSKYLLAERTPSSHFLDFLELSLGPTLEIHIARGNDFVDGLNLALDRRASPYLLTRYAHIREEYDDGPFQPVNAIVSTSAYPKAYLKQSQPVQQHAIEPALQLLADPAYTAANDDFLKALHRQRMGDYDGVLTACAATLEGAIKAAAQQRGWTIKGKGLGTDFQSFASRTATVPDQLKTVVNFIHQRRSKAGDAHGHSAKETISEQEAALFVALTASLVSYLAAAK